MGPEASAAQCLQGTKGTKGLRDKMYASQSQPAFPPKLIYLGRHRSSSRRVGASLAPESPSCAMLQWLQRSFAPLSRFQTAGLQS